MMRTHWVTVDLIQGLASLKRGKFGSRDKLKEHHVKKNTEIGVILLQTKECQELLAIT